MSKLTGKRRKSRGALIKKAQYFDEVIRLYYEEGLNGLEISRIVPVHNSNIYRWLDEYDMQNKTTEASMKETKKRSVAPPRRVTGRQAPQSSPADPISTQSVCDGKGDAATELARLKDRIGNLERQLRESENALREASLRADLYNEIISVAEKKYNVPIRKKAGARQ